MTSLITLIRQRYPTDAHAAALLGISRQAYSQALKRNHLSERTARLAAILLDIDIGAALSANLKPTENTPSPVENPAPDLPSKLHITTCNTTNYARNDSFKKSAHRADNADLLHKITSPDKNKQST